MVPWLEELWNANVPINLTGSLLTEVATDAARDLAPAQDVDLWLEREEHLDAVVGVVLASMQRWAGCSVRAERKGPWRWRLDASAVDRRPLCALHCDLYVNRPHQISTYHLPLVRATFDGSQLLMAPSCVLAWTTWFNVDYSHFASESKMPMDIIARKWASGFDILLNNEEHDIMLSFLRRRHPSWLHEKCPAYLDASGDINAYINDRVQFFPLTPQ